MVDVTLKNGVEKTLRERIPEITEVRDVTDHETGEQPYFAKAAG
jgi:Fe/S biogenesis protein NfuA